MKTDTPIRTGDRCLVNRTPNKLSDVFAVRVMAVAEGWAMVRRPYAMPFVISVKELEKIE